MRIACMKCNNDSDFWVRRERTILNDGTSLSIQVGSSLYCLPRDDKGPYTHVEVGFIQDSDKNPITPPDSWETYSDGSFPSDVYAYVPVEVVEQFIASHGGRKFFI